MIMRTARYQGKKAEQQQQRPIQEQGTNSQQYYYHDDSRRQLAKKAAGTGTGGNTPRTTGRGSGRWIGTGRGGGGPTEWHPVLIGLIVGALIFLGMLLVFLWKRRQEYCNGSGSCCGGCRPHEVRLLPAAHNEEEDDTAVTERTNHHYPGQERQRNDAIAAIRATATAPSEILLVSSRGIAAYEPSRGSRAT